MKKNLHFLFAVLFSICAMSVSAETTTVGDTLEVTYTNTSTIDYGYYQGRLSDGSVLGFYCSGSYAYFCGAISTATSLSIPEFISYNEKKYTVFCCGYSSGYTLDFDEGTSVKSLTLPASMTSIGNYIPSTITELHLLGENPPSLSNQYLGSATVWVPQSAFSTYQSLTTNTNSSWYGVEIHYEGWDPQSLTVNVTTPGTFVSELLKKVSQWSDVDALTVIGSLNAEEMELFSRFSQLWKLDLSQTDIKSITGCHELTKLKSVILPSTVTEIGSNAFSGCTQLSSINTPNVVTIGSSAFNSCSALTSIDLPKVKEIESNAFYKSRLTSISLPVAKTIGASAFYQCSNLKSVSIPEVESLGPTAFSESGITSISLPKVTSIGDGCFSYCKGLQSVSLAEGLEKIPYYCFGGCQSLKTINFPSTLKSIESSAFGGNSSQRTPLTSAILPEGLQIIESYAFDCCSLTTISIPSTIQSIESSAFYGCSGIQDVYCYAIVPPNTTAFTENGMTGATLHVPTFSLTSYMLDGNWYRFNQTVAIEGKLSDLTINQTFTINTHDGLEDKINMNLTQTGHLTLSTSSTFNMGTFTQQQATTANRYIYTGISTLIANSEMKADNINLRLQVPTNRWNFISIPFDVNVSDITCSEGTLWVIRKYSGADRAALTGNTWQNMANGMVLQAGEGYILHCANEETGTVEFVFHPVNNAKKNGLFAYQDVVKPLNTYASEHAHNRSWNLVGNPYPAYFDTHSIEHTGVITVYNGDSYYGSYTAYSLLDDDYVLRPNEAFFVQCPVDATSMTFKAEGRKHEAGNSYDEYYYAPSRTHGLSTQNNRRVYNFTLTGDEVSDRTRLVLNPEAKMDYEISCDASKFISDNPSIPQLYIYDNGIRYAIDERPLGDGIIYLGTRFGATGEYTLTLANNPDESVAVVLTDYETDTQVNLVKESYTFVAQAGTTEKRFTLSMGDEVTGISEMAASPSADEDGIYDLSGRKVSSALKGVYIIKKNGKSRKVVK